MCQRETSPRWRVRQPARRLERALGQVEELHERVERLERVDRAEREGAEAAAGRKRCSKTVVFEHLYCFFATASRRPRRRCHRGRRRPVWAGVLLGSPRSGASAKGLCQLDCQQVEFSRCPGAVLENLLGFVDELTGQAELSRFLVVGKA